MLTRQGKNAGSTLIEIIVVIAILGIFMGIAVPSVARASRSMEHVKALTSRYTDARRALDRLSGMVRRAYPTALSPETPFVGRTDSFDAGGLKLPSDELSFPVLDTGYAHLGSVQRITYRLELTPADEDSPRGLVQTRSALTASAEAGVTQTLLREAVGLDFGYLDDSVEPPEWVDEWPPASSMKASELSGGSDAPALARPPQAVRVTVFTLGAVSRRPRSFTTVINVPSR